MVISPCVSQGKKKFPIFTSFTRSPFASGVFDHSQQNPATNLAVTFPLFFSNKVLYNFCGLSNILKSKLPSGEKIFFRGSVLNGMGWSVGFGGRGSICVGFPLSPSEAFLWTFALYLLPFSQCQYFYGLKY